MFRDLISHEINKLRSYPLQVRVVFLLIILTLVFYFQYKVLLLASLWIYFSLRLIIMAFVPQNFERKIKLLNLIAILLLTTPMSAQLFGYISHTITWDRDYFTWPVWSYFNLRYLKAYFLAIIVFIGYLQTSFFYGMLTNRFIKVPKVNLATDSFIDFCTGIIISTSILFVLGCYGLLNITTTLVIFIPALFNRIFYSRMQMLAARLKTIKIALSKSNLLQSILIFIASSFYLVSILRDIPSGPDAYRVYLLIPKYISENASLPTTDSLILWPFTAEIFISPAYILGGIPVATAVLYTISLLSLVGFYLFFKTINSPKIIFPILIILFITFPPFVRMIDGEFKIDIFLALISTYLYLLIALFRDNTKNFNYLYLIALCSGFLILTKPVSLIYVAPMLLIPLNLIFSDVNLKRLFWTHIHKLALAAIIVPALWFSLYKVDLPVVGHTGLGLAPIAASQPKPNASIYTERQIIMEEQFLYTKKRFTGDLLSYLKLPSIYFTSTNGSYSFSLLDPGLLILVVWLVVLFIAVKKPFNLQDPYFMANISSLGLFLLISPILIWYAAFQVLILTGLLIRYISRISPLAISGVKSLAAISLSISCIGYILFSSFYNYSQPYLTQAERLDRLQGSDSLSEGLVDAIRISEIVNDDIEEKIVLTHHHNFINIPFFYKNYFDRVIFFDNYFTDGYSPRDISDFMSEHEYRYIIINQDIVKDGHFTTTDLEIEEIQRSADRAAELIYKGKVFSLYGFN